PLQGVRVLVVEDDPDGREISRRMLGQLGASVLTAENGAAALLLLEKQRPDLVLADLKMPVMDGYQFGQLVKSNPDYRAGGGVGMPGVPFGQGYRRTGALGFAGHIEKPITLEKLESLARFLAGPAVAADRPHGPADLVL